MGVHKSPTRTGWGFHLLTPDLFDNGMLGQCRFCGGRRLTGDDGELQYDGLLTRIQTRQRHNRTIAKLKGIMMRARYV